MKRIILSLSVVGLSVLGLTGTAQAQVDFGDSDEPIFVAAEKATYKGNMTILHNAVNVRQGTAKIQSDEMKIYREKRETETTDPTATLRLGAVTRIVATGNFKYVTPERAVTGGQGIYYRDRGIIVVTDNVQVRQKGSSAPFVTGEKMVYDLKTGRVKFGEECDSDNCKDRISIRIEE